MTHRCRKLRVFRNARDVGVSSVILSRPDERAYELARKGTVSVRLRRGVVEATGADRLDLINRMSTNAIATLQPGDESTTILTSEKGRIIDVLRLIVRNDSVLIVLAGADVDRVCQWLDRYTIMDDFTVRDLSAERSVLAVHGDGARAAVAQTLRIDPPDAGHVAVGVCNGTEVIITREPRVSGMAGFLLILPPTSVDDVEANLRSAGVQSIDEATFQTLRVEAGQPEVGHELTGEFNPLEAGLVQYVSFTKGCYIGQEVIARLDSYDKVQRHLLGLTLASDPAETDGALRVIDPDSGRPIGEVTSLAYSPALDAPIALAMIRTAHAVPGASVRVEPASGGEAVESTIVKLPFDL